MTNIYLKPTKQNMFAFEMNLHISFVKRSNDVETGRLMWSLKHCLENKRERAIKILWEQQTNSWSNQRVPSHLLTQDPPATPPLTPLTEITIPLLTEAVPVFSNFTFIQHQSPNKKSQIPKAEQWDWNSRFQIGKKAKDVFFFTDFCQIINSHCCVCR